MTRSGETPAVRIALRLRVHYASDVVAGIVLGLAGALAAHQLLG